MQVTSNSSTLVDLFIININTALISAGVIITVESRDWGRQRTALQQVSNTTTFYLATGIYMETKSGERDQNKKKQITKRGTWKIIVRCDYFWRWW